MLLGHADTLRDWKREIMRDFRRRLDQRSRREFLRGGATGVKALLGLSLLANPLGKVAFADEPEKKDKKKPDAPKAVKTGTFYFPRLMFHVKDETGDQWNTEPAGDVILRKRLSELTNINVSQDPIVCKLSEMEDMVRYPFVFATSEGYFDLPANEEKNLKEFLMRGGFVFGDDCVYNKTGDRFFQDFVKIVNKIFPDNPMRKVPLDNEIYNCYFEFPKGAPHLQGVDHGGWGLFEKDTGRIMTYVTPGDLHCGWCSKYFSPAMNEAAIRMGVNIIVYYLTH